MSQEKKKRNPLYYVLIGIIAVCFILMINPNIIGWNTPDPSKWVFGVIPLAQFCIYFFPLIICLSMGGLYLLDYTQKKRELQAKKALNHPMEGDVGNA